MALFLESKLRKVETAKGFLILVFLFASRLFAQEYNFQNFTTQDGLPQDFIYTISQDKMGYLWIGTGNGVSRYNGFKLQNYYTSDSLADNFVTCSISDGDGSVI